MDAQSLALQRPVGRHCLLEVYGCPEALLNDPDFIRRVLVEAAHRAGTTLLNQVIHQFDPYGVTALGLLAESHISIHTWPEYGFAAIDMFTCGDHAAPEKAAAFLADVFQATYYTTQELRRGIVVRS